MKDITIGQLTIGENHPPVIIGELSGNHNGSLERALEIVDAMATAGAQILKLQTYTADTMTIDAEGPGFFISDKDSLWYGNSLYELYQKAYTPWEWHKPIFERARKHGMEAFSSPFDATAVDFLEELDVPAYKIASFENVDIPLIKRVAATGKPMIISTGMASLSTIEDAVTAAKDAGCQDIIVLKCTSNYPASPENSNLATISHMQKLFGCQIGLSDHTLGIGAGIASVAFGATVIEKHITLSRKEGGVDSDFSLEPDELKLLVDESYRAWQAIGKIAYGTLEDEKSSLGFRRSLYIVEDMVAGETITAKNLRAIRPGYGLPPKYMDEVMGKKVTKDVKRGSPMSWDLLG
ncbi:N-acylneuraminate-9-phosphate synthase [gamma proteobacterium IMCC1989]|nr:N-acylneuraminate-9-phosphate synthase [gamma proteobacterium IMCC1989]